MSFYFTKPQPGLTEHYSCWEIFASQKADAESLQVIGRMLDVLIEAGLIDHTTAYEILIGVSPETMGLELTSPSKLI